MERRKSKEVVFIFLSVLGFVSYLSISPGSDFEVTAGYQHVLNIWTVEGFLEAKISWGKRRSMENCAVPLLNCCRLGFKPLTPLCLEPSDPTWLCTHFSPPIQPTLPCKDAFLVQKSERKSGTRAGTDRIGVEEQLLQGSVSSNGGWRQSSLTGSLTGSSAREAFL